MLASNINSAHNNIYHHHLQITQVAQNSSLVMCSYPPLLLLDLLGCIQYLHIADVFVSWPTLTHLRIGAYKRILLIKFILTSPAVPHISYLSYLDIIYIYKIGRSMKRFIFFEFIYFVKKYKSLCGPSYFKYIYNHHL